MSKNLFSLDGRVAVVVGGTSGIGRVLALGLADAGADVVATARRAPLVEEVAAEIEAKGRRTLRIETDVLDRRSLTAASDAIVKAFGHIDVVVYCAGINKRVATIDMFPRRAVGTVVGFGGFAGGIGGIVVAEFAGRVLQRDPSFYLPMFVVSGLIYLVALGVIHLFAPRLERVALADS